MHILNNLHAGTAIIVTDGECDCGFSCGCNIDTLKESGDNLLALGVTVMAVGIGGYDQTTLEAIASESGGKKLIFTAEEFSQIETLLVDALSDAGAFLFTVAMIFCLVCNNWLFAG